MNATADLEALAERLKASESFAAVRVSDDGSQLIAVRQMIFTWAIFSGLEELGYEDRWCYETGTDAALAWVAWSGDAGTEPEGWIRHPRTERRRPHGDASQEYLAA